MNIGIITIDSLRWDTTRKAKTPNLEKLFRAYGQKWVKVYAQATYTLPAHVAIFEDGHFPSNELDDVPQIYTRRKKFRIFKSELSWNKKRRVLYPTPPADNIVKGFSKLGYWTVGVGGVHWFDSRFPTSNFWCPRYFDEFYWAPEFGEEYPDAFERQIGIIKTLSLEREKKVFFFLNISSTHRPCRGDNSVRGQAKALEYVDKHIMQVINLVSKPVHWFILSDHGTCFKKSDGANHHGFYHPKVMEIPMVSLLLER